MAPCHQELSGYSTVISRLFEVRCAAIESLAICDPYRMRLGVGVCERSGIAERDLFSESV
jgi:hypothetical protein